MVPSGYKEDTVYSVVPSDGSGDLAFTRASNGTRINSAGLVEVCPWNLVEYSEQFDNAYWSKTNLSVSANSTTAPNGTTTADSLTTQSTGQCNLIQYLSYNVGVYTMSIYVKKVDSPFIYVEMGSSFVWFNLTTGANSGGSQYTSDWAFVSATSENVGNGWFRFQMVAQCLTAGTYGFRPFQPVFSSGNYTPSAINEVTYLWGAQLNIGSTAKPYFPTTDRLNVPRLTYQNGGGGCPSLLLEKQSTNTALYSEDFSNAFWVKEYVTISTNATTSPDGTQNADKIQEDTSNASHVVGNNDVFAGGGQAVTFSIFLKASERSWAVLRLYNGLSSKFAWYNLASGVLGTVDSGATASIENYGNGWYRCIMTITMSSVSITLPYVFVSTGNNVKDYTGTSGSGLFVWGAQHEASSYPTSYIPTTSSSATRVADACFKTGISSLIGQTEGTIFADIVRTQSTAIDAFWININDNSVNNWIFCGVEATGGRFYVRASNTVIVDQYPALSVGRHKLAIAYKSGSIVGYIDGVQFFTSSSTFTIGSLTGVNLGASSPTTSDNVYTSGQVNQAVIFPTRLTNSELASLTTI